MSHRIYFYCFTKDCSYFTKRIFEALQRFSDELNLKFQKESIPKKFPSLTKELIDGFNNHEVSLSQESVIAPQVIASNTSKKTQMNRDEKLVCIHREC